MVIQIGEKLHVATRRLFPGDVRRHFVGEVVAADGDQVRLEGFSFIFDPNRDDYIKRPEKRVRLLSITDASHVINVLPAEAALEEITYELDDRKLVVTDHKTFDLEVNEFGPSR